MPMNIELKRGMDFRKKEYRREVFLRFHEFHTKHGTHPGCVYFIFPFFVRRYQWDVGQRLWFAFINGHTQNAVTSKIIFDEFPDLATLNLKRLNSWFSEHWGRLAFDTDRRYAKKDFVTAVAEYKYLSGTSQAGYISRFTQGNDPYANFRAAWSEVRAKFRTFGRLSAFCYLEFLRVFEIGKIDCDRLFLEDGRGSRSHRNGLVLVLGRDELQWHRSNPSFSGEYSSETISWLNREGARLLAEAKR